MRSSWRKNKTRVATGLEAIWTDTRYCIAAMAVVMALACYAVYFQADKPSRHVPRPRMERTADGGLAAGAPRPKTPRLSPEERTRRDMRENQKKIDADPTAPDAPAYLNAIGNLAAYQLNDYQEAIRYFELLLHDYPDWEGMRRVYPKLAQCYELVGDQASEQRVYLTMAQVFPRNTMEFHYAQNRLGLEAPPAPASSMPVIRPGGEAGVAPTAPETPISEEAPREVPVQMPIMALPEPPQEEPLFPAARRWR